MRPLEERFPTLYYNIVQERDPKKDVVEEKRTPKGTVPTLYDVVEAVCSTHRVTDVGLMKDLVSSVNEFTTPPKPAEEKAKKAKEN